jgi:hypothetical protein
MPRSQHAGPPWVVLVGHSRRQEARVARAESAWRAIAAGCNEADEGRTGGDEGR